MEGGHEEEDMAFEVVEFREPAPSAGMPFQGTTEVLLGVYPTEADAIDVGRRRWREMRTVDTKDVMWWIVRVPGESLARWIADRSSAEEQILDLRTNELVVVKR
jgi:hypothetical protein